MDQIQALRAEVKRLSEQGSTDFQFTMTALKDMGQSFRQGMDSMGREMEERFNQLAGRMKLQEQRVAAVLGAVDSALSVYENHEARLQALESRNEPAA
jgi:hypothetical protein